MLKKIYAVIKDFIKEYYLLLILITVIALATFIKLPYSIMMPGGAKNLNERYEISGSYPVKGSLNLAYVTEMNANVISFLVAKINPYWDVEKKSEVILPNESNNDSLKRMKLGLEESVDTAKVVALRSAGYDIDVNNTKVYVTYIMDKNKNDLQINDQIISIDNNKVASLEDITNIIKDYQVNDIVKIKVLRDTKEVDCYAKLFEYEKKLVIGVTTIQKFDYDSPFEINYKDSKKEYGSSGGLMNALAIYNAITEEDITKGKKIIGTGTIDINGNIGKIDGVKYKLLGASFKKCDIFIVPEANYDEAIKVKKKYKLKIKIVKVKHIDDAINYLKGM